MKTLHSLYLVLLIALSSIVYAQESITFVYDTGSIPSDRAFTSLPGSSACPGELVFEIPEGNWVVGMDVSYSFTSTNFGYMSEQRSWLYCPNTLVGENSITSGSGGSQGTQNYTRNGLNIANMASGAVIIQLHAGRTTMGGTGCETTHHFIANNTWTVTLYYEPIVHCTNPGMLSVYNVYDTSAEFFWLEYANATEWEMELVEEGNAPTGDPTQTGITEIPYIYEGLTPTTTYNVYLRSVCGDDEYTDWILFPQITTQCEAITVFPFFENFNLAGFPPACWKNQKIAGTGNPGTWDRQTNGYNPTCTPVSGAGMARFNSYFYASGTRGILVTPLLDIPNDDYRINFYLYRSSEWGARLDHVNVYTNNQPVLAGSEFLGRAHRVIGQAPVVGSPQWYQFSFQFPNDSQGYTFVIFEAVSEYGQNLFIDNINIFENPCLSPTELNAFSITDTEAELSWTDNAGAELWDIELVIVGENPTGVPTYSNVDENPYLLTNLSPETAYEFYVRADCGANKSNWRGPYLFVTLPEIVLYELILEVSPENSGVVTGEGWYEYLEPVPLTANAEEGYQFVHWIDQYDEIVSTIENFDYEMPEENMTLTAVFDDLTNISDILTDDISIYPNPANNILYVNSGFYHSLTITDLKGRTLKVINKYDNIISIDLSEFSSGLYYLILENGDDITVRNFVINR